MSTDYYAVLGVSPDATSEEIRVAWRRGARESHPDRNQNAESASIILLNEAWAVLGDPTRRKAYDLGRSVSEPAAVQDAILRAALSVVFTVEELGETGEVADHDLLLVRPPLRLSVRPLRVAGPGEVGSWRETAAIRHRPDSLDCAVLLASRVVAAAEVRLRLVRPRCPVVVIDLIDSELYGEFPCPMSRRLFRLFLG